MPSNALKRRTTIIPWTSKPGLLDYIVLVTLMGCSVLFLAASCLHAESWVGADAANACLRARDTVGGDKYNFMTAKDQPGPLGMPLGGIGAGCVPFAPDGHFTRIGGIYNLL